MIFRTDSSIQIGSGHLQRCLTLARAFRSEGFFVHFFCAVAPGSLHTLISNENFPLTLLKNTYDGQPLLEYFSKEKSTNLLIVDHYKLDADWESQFKNKVHQLWVIDDLHNRKHDCDLLIDSNFDALQGNPYRNLLPSETQCLLGPQYALLKDSFLHKPQRPPPNDVNSNLLVFWGGTDPERQSLRYLKHLSENQTENFVFHFLVTSANPDFGEISKTIWPQNIVLHIDISDLRGLLEKCSLYLGSGGTITWERMYCGLPGVVISVAENQIPNAVALHQAGYHVYLGTSQEIDPQQALTAVEKLAKEEKIWFEMARKSQQLVDGQGISKISQLAKTNTSLS